MKEKSRLEDDVHIPLGTVFRDPKSGFDYIYIGRTMNSAGCNHHFAPAANAYGGRGMTATYAYTDSALKKFPDLKKYLGNLHRAALFTENDEAIRENHEEMRKALEIIGLGDTEDPIATAAEVLVETGFWHPQAQEILDQRDSEGDSELDCYVEVTGEASNPQDGELPGIYRIRICTSRPVEISALNEDKRAQIARATLQSFHDHHNIAEPNDFEFRAFLRNGDLIDAEAISCAPLIDEVIFFGKINDEDSPHYQEHVRSGMA